jgi:hypothetical protein
MVASVIAALKNGTGVHGVAYESKVLAIRADSPASCQPGAAEDSCTFNDTSLIAAIDYAKQRGQDHQHVAGRRKTSRPP